MKTIKIVIPDEEAKMLDLIRNKKNRHISITDLLIYWIRNEFRKL